MNLEDVVIVRMASGEEIIGIAVEWNNPEYFAIKKPAIIIPTGEGRIGLSPYLPYAEMENDIMPVKESYVVWTLRPVAEFAEQYYQSFVSDLLVPSENKKIMTPAGAGLKLST